MEDFDIIKLINNIRGLTIQCDSCDETLVANRANLFDIRKKPHPKRFINAIDWQHKNIIRRYELIDKDKEAVSEKLKNLKKRVDELRHRKTNRPVKIKVDTRRINIGQIVEIILPSTSKFPFDSKDCRALFNPVDYISFNGLERKKKVDSISFIEVKTGKSSLIKSQKQIRENARAGKVDLIHY